MAVTSQVKSTQTIGETYVQDWQGAGLLKPSTIKPVITTIERGLVISQLGQLKENDQAALIGAIDQILGQCSYGVSSNIPTKCLNVRTDPDCFAYDKKRAEGKRHNQAIRALGRHLVRVIWAMVKQGRKYEVR